jgi:hypothetical protein
MLFQTEKAALKPSRIIANAYDAMFLTSFAIGFGSALLFAGSLDKLSKAMLTTTGMAGLACYTVNCKLSEKVRKVDSALETVQWESMKYQLKEEEEVYQLAAEVDGATRKVELILNKSNPWEWGHWARRAGVESNMPPLQDLTAEPVEQPVSASIPSPNVAPIDQSQVDSVVAPDLLVKLDQLSAAYPQYIRVDAIWIDELCDAASNSNMSKRFNHHFCITGETQSGKSTIAGVIINKIAFKSETPSTIIGNDPKDGVSRWLCKFSYRFDGVETIDNWIQFAFQKANDQKKAYASNPKEVGELFFVQDEVDSVYNNGKGFLGFLGADKKVQSSQAQSLQSLWNFLIKYMAGAKGHYIGIGQSPLSGDTGLSRPAYKSCCFIALGNTANYIFDHPSDFLNVNKETQEVLQQAFELMTSAGQRCALVIPMRGNPYVALIPQFDVDGYQAQSTEVEIDKIEATEHVLKTVDQLMEEMISWMQSLDELPSPQSIASEWASLSGKPPSEKLLKIILDKLGLG